MICSFSFVSKSACPWMLFSNGNGTRLLIEILSAVDREVCWLTKGGVICLTAVSSASYVCSIQRYIYALISVSPSWTFLSSRWHPSSSFRVTQTTKTNGIYLSRSVFRVLTFGPVPHQSPSLFLLNFKYKSKKRTEHQIMGKTTKSFSHVVRFFFRAKQDTSKFRL